MNIYTSETEYLKTEVQRLRALVRAQQITIDKLEAQPVQKRPQNCGTGYCSCIECVMEPEQEPVAKVTSETGDPDITMSWWHEPALPVGTPLYTTPPQRKPLTDEEIEEMANDFEEGYVFLYRSFARAIETAHNIKEKNT